MIFTASEKHIAVYLSVLILKTMLRVFGCSVCDKKRNVDPEPLLKTPSPVGAQKSSSMACAATAHLPITQLTRSSARCGPLLEPGLVPWWAHPWSPCRAPSPPAGALHHESLQRTRSASANLGAVFLILPVFVYRGVLTLLRIIF